MSLDATYDPLLSRVRLTANTLGASATYAVFDRTVDGGVTYETVRGGVNAAVSAQTAALDDYEFPAGVATTYRVRSYSASDVLQATFTDTITQDLDQVWLKVPALPVLNQPVEVSSVSEVAIPSRATVFPIVGRSYGVAVGDIPTGEEFTLQLLTRTMAARDNLAYLFRAGEVVHVHLPSTVDYFPGGYFSVGTVSRASLLRLSSNFVWQVPLTAVAAPGPEVVGSSYTWTSVLADYATWSDLLADNATWSVLAARTGTPSDVIVP